MIFSYERVINDKYKSPATEDYRVKSFQIFIKVWEFSCLKKEVKLVFFYVFRVFLIVGKLTIRLFAI